METIKKGSRGAAVKELQKRLHLIEDGIFGPLTLEAVLEFQKANGLTADGIVGPKTWAALGVSATPKRNIKEIIVHCTATPEGEDYSVDTIRGWHVNGNGWSDIGYHFIVYRNGEVKKGRDESKAGAHTSGHNSNSIGVCYVGGCAARSNANWNRMAKDTRTPEQKAALRSLLKELKAKYPNAKIYGHRDFSTKPCPSFDAKTEYKDL